MTQQLLIESPEKTHLLVENRHTNPAFAQSFQGGLHPVAQLQRTLGNRNVAKLIQAKRLTPEGKIIGFQQKLTVGAADDQYQQEAEPIQAKSAGSMCDSFEAGDDVETQVSQSKGLGSPLPDPVRTYMEPRFGVDFSDVRVHTGSDALQMNQAVGAQAFTHGSDIYFGAGHGPSNFELTAHELTHVVQQDGGRSYGVVQRAEVDDRSCAGLTDIEPDVDDEVNREIAAVRAAAGTPFSVPAFLQDVYMRLGQGIVSPIESFIEGLPASKRNLPPNNLAGTKYSGVSAVNKAYLAQQLLGGHVVGSSAKVHSVCIGADKLGHLFDLGFLYWVAISRFGITTAAAQGAGRASEIGGQGLGVGVAVGTGVYSNADLVANLAGLQFYKDLEANPSSFTFHISKYITDQWNEQVNPNFYESSLGTVVWSNLLTGPWQGEITVAGGASAPDTIKFDLTATTSGVTGTYETPAGTAKPANKGKITGGTITQKTTTVSGQVPGDPAVSAPVVTGISIQFDWGRGTRSGKGMLDSVNEQTLNGTWGTGASRTGGGTLKLKKV